MPNPTNRSEIKQTLRDHSVEPTRGMGQNFLADKQVAAWIVEQLEICAEDTVIEIGPGLGALTEHLVGRGKETVLVEKDTRLAARLRAELKDRNVRVIEGDAVRFDLRPLFKHQPVKVIGALPYSCGTEILRNFLANPSPVSRAVFVMQKEVIDRICAPPATPDRGLLSLRIQSRWEALFLRKLPPDIFVPRPKVDSAVALLTPRNRKESSTFDDTVLDRLLRMGFCQRRKMLRKLLPELPGGFQSAAEAMGFAPTVRAEELSLSQWIGLARLADTHTLKDVPQRGDEMFDVVNELNEVICQRPRREVHAEKLRHRAVHVFVFNSQGELFLQLRSHLKDAEPSKWDSSAAGHLDVGESYLAAAVREVEEELGIQTTPDKLELVATVAAGPGTGWEFVELYRMRWEGAVRWPSSEIETGAWFPATEITEWIASRPQDFAAGFIECWRAMGNPA